MRFPSSFSHVIGDNNNVHADFCTNHHVGTDTKYSSSVAPDTRFLSVLATTRPNPVLGDREAAKLLLRIGDHARRKPRNLVVDDNLDPADREAAIALLKLSRNDMKFIREQVEAHQRALANPHLLPPATPPPPVKSHPITNAYGIPRAECMQLCDHNRYKRYADLIDKDPAAARKSGEELRTKARRSPKVRRSHRAERSPRSSPVGRSKQTDPNADRVNSSIAFEINMAVVEKGWRMSECKCAWG